MSLADNFPEFLTLGEQVISANEMTELRSAQFLTTHQISYVTHFFWQQIRRGKLLKAIDPAEKTAVQFKETEHKPIDVSDWVSFKIFWENPDIQLEAPGWVINQDNWVVRE